MSLNQLLNNPNTPCLPWKRIKVYDLDVCNDIVSPNADITNLDVVNINGAPYPSPSERIPQPFVANKVLRTNNTATGMLWGDVPHGNSKELLQTNLAGNGVEWNSSIDIPGNLTVTGSSQLKEMVLCEKELAVDGDLGVQGDTALINTSITGTMDINGNLRFVGAAGSIGQVLTKTGANTQSFQTPSLPSGAANQVYVMNNAGTGQGFANSINLPGDATVNGTTTTLNLTSNGFARLVSAASIDGDLQFNNISGSVGQFIKKTALNDQAFATFELTDIPAGPNNRAIFTRSGVVQYSQIGASDIVSGSNGQYLSVVAGVSTWVTPLSVRFIRYATTFAAQDLNADAGPSFVTFSTSPFSNISNSTGTAVTAVSQSSATQFVINTAGTYDIVITGYVDPTSTGIGSAVVLLSVDLNGTEIARSCVVCRQSGFGGVFTSIMCTAGSVIRIIRRRSSGIGTLNLFGSPTTVPNFTSTISINLVNTVA